MLRLYFMLLALACLCPAASAQNDCTDAVVLCGDVTGYGRIRYNNGFGIQEINPGNVCNGAETNSVWFKLMISTGGTLQIYIHPLDNEPVDYNFWVFGPTATCNNLGNAIRCSSTEKRSAIAGSENITGTYPGEDDTSESTGEGNGFVKQLNVNAGDTYYLLVDQSPQSEGFVLSFDPSTASFIQGPIFPNTTMSGNYVQQRCDDDGINDLSALFDLTIYEAEIFAGQPMTTISYHHGYSDALLGINAISNATAYLNTPIIHDPIYMRLENTLTGCITICAQLLIITNTVIAGQPENLMLCDEGGDGMEIFDLSQNNVLVQNGTTQPVSYHVTEQEARDNINPLSMLYQNIIPVQTIWARLSGTEVCYMYDVKPFTIALTPMPPLDYTLDINDLQQGTASITIRGQNIENFEFSLDGINYSSTPTISGLEQGEHTLYIRPTSGCGPVITDTFFILDFPKFFTPNADGNNDLWRIPYTTLRPGVKITIFDRFGNLIDRFGGMSSGWDGTLRGTPLPATDYWFVATLENGRTAKGHFSLIR